MSISDLKEIPCQYCGKRGLRVRIKITKKLVMLDHPSERVFWHSLCEYCGKENKILYEEV